MPVVPFSRVEPRIDESLTPSDTHLAMAAAMLRIEGLETTDQPTKADQLKDEEHKMEGRQRYQDSVNPDEQLPKIEKQDIAQKKLTPTEKQKQTLDENERQVKERDKPATFEERFNEKPRKISDERDMTDEEFKNAFTLDYSHKTQDKGHMYEPKDAEGIKKHLEDIGEGFFRQDQKGMKEFLKENSDDYQVLRTPQEGNGKRGYYIRRKLMM